MAIDFMSAGGAVLDTTTAGAGDIKSGKTAYNGDGELVAGTMVDHGAKTASLAPGGSYTIPAGYHNGEGKVTANSVSLSGNANAGQVLSGYTFYKDNYNTKLTGTMANKGAVSASVDPGSTYTIPAGYHNGSGKVSGNRKYNTVYIGQNSGLYGNSITYNVKSNFPSIYSKISRYNFIGIPYQSRTDYGSGDRGGTVYDSVSDSVSYNSSTGVVTCSSIHYGRGGVAHGWLYCKWYMIY